MTDLLAPRTERIATLNDRCRFGLDRHARIVVTRACMAHFAPDDSLPSRILAQAALLHAIRRARFASDSPERDFGIVSVRFQRVFFKIDYYANDLQYGSEDPADASRTVRVMTIMLPEDY